MKVNEVPQDRRDFKQAENMKKLVYAVDKEGKYTGVSSAGWEVENFATRQAWDDIDETLRQTAADVRAGKVSPVLYYMHKNLMELSLLANYVGKWQWQVKRHFKPEVFRKLKPGLLTTYARIFNITIDELVNFGKDKL